MESTREISFPITKICFDIRYDKDQREEKNNSSEYLIGSSFVFEEKIRSDNESNSDTNEYRRYIHRKGEKQ